MSNTSSIKTPLMQYTEWLHKQGLNDLDASRLQLRLMTPTEASVFLQFLPSSHVVAMPYPSTDFIRFRLLKPSKKAKYLSAKGSGCTPVYLPSMAGKDWEDTKVNTNDVVCITEGEIKAYWGCKTGVQTIGLGGVEMQATLFNSGWEWRGRQVLVCFDHDEGQERGAYKPQVANALGKLCASLIAEGAEVMVVNVGMVEKLAPEHKWGLDDALRAGVGWEDLMKTLSPAPEWCSMMSELLEECVLVTDTDKTHIYGLTGGYRKTPGDFHAAHVEKVRKNVKPDGKVQMQKVSELWMIHPARLTAKRYDLNPLLPFGVQESRINLWKGYPVYTEVDEAFTAEWQKFMEGLFGEYWEWIGLWTAHMLNHPEQQTNQAVLLVTSIQGIGKSLYGEIIIELVGKHGIECSADRMFKQFNAEMEAKTFVMVNELDVKFNAREGQLNDLLAADTMYIEPKGKDIIELPNLRRWYMTTNTSSPARLSKGQRRVLVIRPPRLVGDTRGEWGQWVGSVIASARRDPRKLGAIRKWFNDLWFQSGTGEGVWNPTSPVPITEIANEVAEASRTDNQIIVDHMIEWIEEFDGKWVAIHPMFKKQYNKVWGEISQRVRDIGGTVAAKIVSEEGGGGLKQWTVYCLGGVGGPELKKRNDGGHWAVVESQAARDTYAKVRVEFERVHNLLSEKR